MRKISFIFLFLFYFDSFASDLKSPMDLYSAAVLPKGVRNMRFRGMVVNGNDKFNEIGNAVPLSDPFYKMITWNDLIDPITDAENKNLLGGYLASKNTNLNDVVGLTTGEVHVQAKPIVPIFALGITDRLTAAVAVPVIRYQYNADTGFVYGDNLKQIYHELENDKKISELNELSRKMVNPVATKLRDFGYDPLEPEKGTLLGDVSLNGKYHLLKYDDFSMAIQMGLTTPTGKAKNENKVVAIGSDHIWSLASAAMAEYRLTSWAMVGGAAGYTYKVPDTVEKRIPYREDSKVTPDKDDRVKRKLGDEMFAQASLKWLPIDGVTFSGGYTIQYKNADSYKGSKFENERYRWMEADTIQRLETVTVGLRLDTIQLYLSKKFAAPMELAVNYSVPISGKNATKDPLTTIDASLFF